MGFSESLATARELLQSEARRSAIGRAVATHMRKMYRDKDMARIVLATYDMDVLGSRIEAQADYGAWATVVGRHLSPVAPGDTTTHDSRDDVASADATAGDASCDIVSPDTVLRHVGVVVGNIGPDSVVARARTAYQKSLADGAPLSGAELGRMFGKNARWGQRRRAEVEAVAVGNGG